MTIKTRGGNNRGQNAKLHYHVNGSGTPLVLLHGNNQDLRSFEEQVEFFKDYYQVIAIDSPGHGKSSLGKKKLTIENMSIEITHLLHRLNIERALFIGFSDGGNIGLQIAIRSPELVIAMTIIGANIHMKGIKTMFRISIILWHQLLKLFSFIPEIKRQSQIISLMAKEPNISVDMLKYCNVPILLLAGERDVIDGKHTKEMGALLPNATVEIIEGAGHSLLNQKKKEVHPLILSYFRTIKNS
jgi:pimeloyl-ACP methyl ester carboxylesterase